MLVLVEEVLEQRDLRAVGADMQRGSGGGGCRGGDGEGDRAEQRERQGDHPGSAEHAADTPVLRRLERRLDRWWGRAIGGHGVLPCRPLRGEENGSDLGWS